MKVLAPERILDQITPVRRFDSSRAGEISKRLERIIAGCALATGERLGTKDDLRRRFQVSPATMNEAVRILESRGVIATRRGLKGGVFVSSQRTDLIEHCRAVSTHAEPLVVAEATPGARLDAIAELDRLVSNLAVAVEDLAELRRRCLLLGRRIAEIGSSPLLTAIHTALLDILERGEGPFPDTLLAKCRHIVGTIASGDAERPADVAPRVAGAIRNRH